MRILRARPYEAVRPYLGVSPEMLCPHTPIPGNQHGWWTWFRSSLPPAHAVAPEPDLQLGCSAIPWPKT